uniref:IF rod domain-containing protein n=1 Tax=Otolemur garnettii TaxID=30611 RepID=H0XX27_OTOGA
QSVESTIHGLKVIEDTNVTQLQLETEIDSLKEELLFMKKNYEEEVKLLQAQIASSGLTVEVDAPKSQDLSKNMADMQAQYDELAWKNQEELAKTWSQQFEESTSVVTSQFAEVRAGKTMLIELTHIVQSLVIQLNSMRNQKSRLEDNLSGVEACYAMQMEQINGIRAAFGVRAGTELYLEECQAQEYEALVNIKVKLEAEIATYCCLVEDGEGFNLGDALESSISMQTILKTRKCFFLSYKILF